MMNAPGTRPRRRSFARMLACGLLLALARPAAADPNVAQADKLFAEAIKLRDSNLQLACEKFAESLRLNPQAIGTLLNVALCDEQLGRVASALRRFEEARERAIELKFGEHLKAAEQKIAALRPEVPHLAIRFAQPPAAGTKVVIDDRVIPPADLGDVRVDPGERTVIVSAPGRVAFQRAITIAKRQQLTVEIPRLARQVSARRTAGKLTVGGGVAMLAASATLGYLAHRRYDAQFNDTNTGPCRFPDQGSTPECNESGFTAVGRARTLGNVGTVIGGVGGAAVLVGAYLWFTAPRARSDASERAVSVVPQLAPGGAGLAVFGRF